MTRIATENEQAALTEIGMELLETLDRFVVKIVGAETDDEDQRSHEVGRALLMALLVAGNDVKWLNRPRVVQGLGYAFGEALAQQSDDDGMRLTHHFSYGVTSGRLAATKALTPVGSA